MKESEFLSTYGEAIYRDFLAFMRGQTVGIVDGERYFYKHDIANYFAGDDERFFD